MKDKEINKFLSENLKTIKNELNDIQDILFSDIMLCSCYFIKYLETLDDTYFDKFSDMLNKMSSSDKIRTLSCITTYLKENKAKALKKQKNN